MAYKELTMKLYRPKLGVGAKTLGALSVIFWVPMTVLVGLLFYLFQDVMQEELTSHIKASLKGASSVYEERATAVKGLMMQAREDEKTRNAFQDKNSDELQTTLLNLAKKHSFLNIIVAVDEHQRIIGRRNNRLGDVASLGDLVPKALISGDIVLSTELVSKEFLNKEDEELANHIKDVGMVQFVVAPIKKGDKVLGALIGGMLLTGDPWLGNNVHSRFDVDLALFAGKTPETFSLHAAASLPRTNWVIGQDFPKEIKHEVALGKPYYGPLFIFNKDTTVAYEPIKDSRNSIIGALGVSKDAENINSLVLTTIGTAVVVTAVLGLCIAGVLVFFVHSDITRPMKFMVEAMDRFGAGEMDVMLDLKTGDEFEKLSEGFNVMATGIRKREERFKKHNEVAKLFMSTLDLDELLDKTLQIVVGITESQLGIVYLWEKQGDCLTPHAQYGTQTGLASLKIGEGYPGRAAKELKTLLLNTPESAESSASLEMGFAQSSPKEVAYIPLSYQGNILGVLVLGSVENYNEDIIQLFDFLADQISIALDNAIMHQRVQELSITDGLTGLYNRRYLNDRLEEEWNRSIRHNQPISMILSDIDNFKSVNDTYGHDKGDDVLRNVSRVFSQSARKEDLVARYGGEEFVIVMFNTDSAGAEQMAERLCTDARNEEYPFMDRGATLSVGVATFPGVEDGTIDDLVKAADQAMYKAKMSGKDKVVVWDEQQQS